MSSPPEGWPGGLGAGGSLCLGPSLCPPWANNAGVIGDAQVMGGAAPILLRFVVACRPPAWSVRSSCALVRVRAPVSTPAGAGGGGRGGVRRADPAAPPGRRGPFWGRGDVPSASGGMEGRRPRGPQAGGGEWGGEDRGGRAAVPQPPPLGGWPVAPRPCPPSSLAHPPWVYTFGWGCRAAVGARRGLVGRRWVSVAGGEGGEGGLFAAVCSPAFPGRPPMRAASSAHSWVPRFLCGPRRRRRAAGRHRAMRG